MCLKPHHKQRGYFAVIAEHVSGVSRKLSLNIGWCDLSVSWLSASWSVNEVSSYLYQESGCRWSKDKAMPPADRKEIRPIESCAIYPQRQFSSKSGGRKPRATS